MIFKRKKNKKHASPVKLPKGSNIKRTLHKRKRKFNFPILFRREKTFRGRRRLNINFKFLFIPILFSFLIGMSYLAVKYVLDLRSNTFRSEVVNIGEVIGLEKVPEYPGSEFMFKNNMSDSTVKEFLSGGNSAYRLPIGTKVEDFEKYYEEVLPPKGWELVERVSIGTEDKKYGQYWVKNGKGLRIYTKFRDIWYETITDEEARTALANKVKEEIEREMLMASSEKQDLLPDYPWKIQIPKEYIIRYSATDLKDFRAVKFQKMGSNDYIELYPIARWQTKELDYMLEEYCRIISEDETTYSIINTVPVSFRNHLSLKGTISNKEQQKHVYVIPNTFNYVVYVLSSTKENDPLFEYIFENVYPMGEEN
jgi:hypothetical protein